MDTHAIARFCEMHTMTVFTAVMGAVVGFAFGATFDTGLSGGILLSRAKEWQTLIGAGVAVAAAAVALLNVRRQLRIALLSREEDRLERSMPGLRAANMLLINLVGLIGIDDSSSKIRSIYKKYNMSTYDEIRRACGEVLVPCEPLLRDRVEAKIIDLFMAVEGYERQETKRPEWQEGGIEESDAQLTERFLACVSWQSSKENLAKQYQELIDLQREIEERIERFRKWQPRFRKTIEHYFRI